MSTVLETAKYAIETLRESLEWRGGRTACGVGALEQIDAAIKRNESVRSLIQDRYNHASMNGKPEVAAAMKELLERMETL